MKAMPRWGGMNETPNGKVRTRKATPDELDTNEEQDIHELDYAGKTIIWG
jgi:hypothetical protein